MRLPILLLVVLLGACKAESRQAIPDTSSPAAAFPGTETYPSTYSFIKACDGADSLLRALAGTTSIDTAFDLSAEFNSESRPGCRVSFHGIPRVGASIGDSIIHHWTFRLAPFATRFQADGIGDNLSGLILGSSLCLLHTMLDTVDDAEEGPIQASDTVSVTISCVERVPADTVNAAT